MCTVLIIDDDDDLRLLLNVMLKRLNCHLLSARNGDEGLIAAFQDPRPDLILLDIMMPGLSGHDTCRQLRQRGYMGKIVMISAQSDEVVQRTAQECGADGGVQKPLSLQELKNQVALVQVW